MELCQQSLQCFKEHDRLFARRRLYHSPKSSPPDTLDFNFLNPQQELLSFEEHGCSAAFVEMNFAFCLCSFHTAHTGKLRPW